MKSNTTQTANSTKKSILNGFTPLSRKQLQTITGGEDPKISRGTKTTLQQ